MAEITVVMVQMNSSVVSLLSLSPLSKQCSRLSYGLMPNHSSCAVGIRSRYKYWELSLRLLSFSMNRMINSYNYNMDRVGKIRLVLIVVTTDNVICFSSVSISLLVFIQLFVGAIFFSFNCKCKKQILVTTQFEIVFFSLNVCYLYF